MDGLLVLVTSFDWPGARTESDHSDEIFLGIFMVLAVIVALMGYLYLRYLARKG